MRPLLYVVVAFTLVGAGRAVAQPVFDNNAGFFYDDYGTSTGLFPSETVNAVRDPPSLAVTLTGTWTPPASCCADSTCEAGENCVPPPALTGHFTTVDIAPSSFDSWGSVYLEHSELVANQISVYFDAITANGTVSFGPLPRIATTPSEAPYTLRFSLDGVDAALYTKGRVRVAMTAATAVKPKVTTLKVTWKPVPKMRLVLDSPTTVCSQATLTVKNQVAVSFTDAKNFLVTIAAPTGTLPAPPLPIVDPAPFSQSATAAFVNATEGGQYHAGPGVLTLAPGVTVQPGNVYWYRANQPAGTSFILSVSFQIPQGLLNQTAYSLQSRVSATNMPTPVNSNTANVVVGPTAPNPWIQRTIGNVYNIDGVDYSYPDRDLTFGLYGYNHSYSLPACGENYYQAWVWDDLTPIAAKIKKPLGTLASGITNISNGGQVSPAGGTTTWDGVQIPGNVVYWDLRTLTVGQWYSLSYGVRLEKYVADGGTLVRDEVINQCGNLKSGFRSASAQSCRSFRIGVPDSPTGTFALGDRIRGGLSVSAGGQDNSSSKVEFNERYALAMFAGNRGVSVLNNVVMLNKIPTEVTLESVYTPPSANAVVRYYIGTGFSDPQSPPTLDADGNPPAADAALWLSSMPANLKSVTWVYVQVPALGSNFFPNLVTAPTSVTAEINVTVDQPNGACAQFLVQDRMVGRIYGYITPEMTVTSPVLGLQPRLIPPNVNYTTGSAFDSEWAEVSPRTPNLSGQVYISQWPTTMVGSGILNVSASIRNAQNGGSPTGPLLEPVVVIQVPKLAVNGGPLAPLAFGGSMSAPGASIDFSQLATTGQITFTYPTLDALQSRSISFNLVVPKGFVSGANLTSSIVANGRDAYCGPTSGSNQSASVLRGEPSLYLTKTVDFGVAGEGSELNYELTVANLGQAVATGAWVVDRIPNPVTLASLSKPAWVDSVWFSAKPPPTLPDLISNDFLFSDSLIRQHFTQGTYGAPDVNGDRVVTWPAGMTPRWIAWRVVDPSLNPPVLVTDLARKLSFKVTVNGGVPENTIANNDELGLADGLLQTIGLRAVTIISDAPSLRLGLTCGAEVLAGGEASELVLPYYNDSANEDRTVTVDVDLSDFEFESFTHVWNSTSTLLGRTATIVHQDLGDGLHRFTIVQPPDVPLDSLEGGTLFVRYRAAANAETGDILPVTVLGLAENSDGIFSTFGRCQTLISNPDIQVQKSIDQTDPPSGERVTFTLFLKNAGAHWAPSVVLSDVLPTDFNYVVNSASILSPGWTGNASYNAGNRTLTWSNLKKTGVTPPTATPPISPDGFMPGASEVIITFKADVGQVGPDHPLQNCASATTTLVEETLDNNQGCATAKTPLPDLQVVKSGPTNALPGARVTFALSYRNGSREIAVGSHLVERLPYLPNDSYPTAAAVKYAGFHGSAGEVAYFSGAARNGAEPAFNPASPTSNGWSSTPTTPVNWIAFVLPSPLGALSQARTIEIDFDLQHPISRLLPEAGTRFENCVSAKMGGPGSAADGDPSNNESCATVGTPGIDLALAAVCDPAGDNPGLRPNDIASYTLKVTNRGTTISYGVRLTPSPDQALDNPLTQSLTASALDAAGQTVALRDEAGDARNSAVSWTLVGNEYVLGNTTPGSANYYRTVGLPPGATVELTFVGKITSTTLSGTVVTESGVVTPDYGLAYQEGVSQKEELLANNTASCDVTIWRPDLVIQKDVELIRESDGGSLESTVANLGDRLRYTLTLSNLGRAAATNAVLQDFFPPGATYIPGTLTGDLSGTTSEFADPDFNWTPSGDANSIGLRISWPGSLDVGGDGAWTATTNDDFWGGNFDGTTVDTTLQAVVLAVLDGNNSDSNTSGNGTLYCTSGEKWLIPASQQASSHTPDFTDNPWWGLYSNLARTYPYNSTASEGGCCLEPGSVAQQVCLASSQSSQQNWLDNVRYCDAYYYSYGGFSEYGPGQSHGLNGLREWTECVCDDEADMQEAACRADCQEMFDSCIATAQAECQTALDTAQSAWSDCCTLNGGECGGCGSEPTGDCNDPTSPYFNDTTGTSQDFGSPCSAAYQCAQGEVYDNCSQNAEDYRTNCNSDHATYIDVIAPLHTETCGEEPYYPCFAAYGPPPVDRCDTTELCAQYPAPDSGQVGKYTSPIAPTSGEDGPVRVQSWTSLTLSHDFGPDNVQVTLKNPTTGAPIPGFVDRVPDASGQISLASLSSEVQSFVVESTLESGSQGCLTLGPTVDISNTNEASWQNDYVPTYAVRTLPDGTMVRAMQQSYYSGDYSAARNFKVYVSDKNGNTQVFDQFRYSDTGYSESTFIQSASIAADGTIALPHATGYQTNNGEAWPEGTALLVKQGDGTYAFEALPSLDFDPTWGAYLISNNWSYWSNTGVRIAVSKDTIIGPLLSGDQAGWTTCNQDLVDGCAAELDQALTYYDEVQTCASWVDCLQAAHDACWAQPDTSTCSNTLTDTSYTGLCAGFDYDSGCSTNEGDSRWQDYLSYRAGNISVPEAIDCDMPTYWGERAGYGADYRPYGYVQHSFSNFNTYQFYFQNCDSLSGQTILASFHRGSGGWSSKELPGNPSESINAQPGSTHLVAATPDGTSVMGVQQQFVPNPLYWPWYGSYATRLVEWKRGSDGHWMAPTSVASDIGVQLGQARGKVSDDGTTLVIAGPYDINQYYFSHYWETQTGNYTAFTPNYLPVWRRSSGGTWEAVPVGSEITLEPNPNSWNPFWDMYNRVQQLPHVVDSDPNTQTLAFRGYREAPYYRWVTGRYSWDGSAFTEELMPQTSSGSDAYPLAVGPEGTIVGYFNWSPPSNCGLPTHYGAFAWPPGEAPSEIKLEAGYRIVGTNVTTDGKVLGYYAPISNIYDCQTGQNLYPPAEFGAFVFGCGGSARPSLDQIDVAYDAAQASVIQFDVAVADQCQSQIANEVSVSNDIEEITLANNQDDATAGVNSVSLETSVTASKVAVSLNDNIVYTYTVKNAGPGIAQNVDVTGLLPAEVDVLSGTVPRTFAELAPGQTQTWEVSTRVNTNAPNLRLTATVEATTDTIQCDVQKTSSSVQSLTGSWPNVAVTKTGPATATVSTGTTPTALTWNLVVSSDGNDTARGITLTDVLPAGVTYVSSTPPATQSGNTLSWDIGNLAPGASVPVSITVTLGACESADTTLTNSATVATTSTEANLGDNSATSQTSLLAPLGRLRADIAIDRTRVRTGERIWYTVRYWNFGAGAVSNAVLTVPLPPNATFVAGSATGLVAPTANALTFNLGTLGLGASGSVGFAVTADGGSLATSNVATLNGSGACPATATFPSAQSDTSPLVISKAANVATACANETPQLTWSITVVNRGATALSNVTITDLVPNSTSYVGGSITGLGANATGSPTLLWNLGTLAAGRGVTVTYRTTTPTGTLALVTNTAAVSATGVASVTSNTATVLADCQAPLALDKSWTGVCSLQGTAFAVTLLARNRTNTAQTVTLTDAVPSSLEIVDRGGATGTGNDIVFADVTLAPQSTTMRTFTVRVASGVTDGTPITNQGSMTTGSTLVTSNAVTSVPITCAAPATPACQTVTCSLDGACVYPAINNGGTCSDSSLCTENDTCQNGACVGSTVNCNDDIVCTADSCNPQTGCVNNAAIMAGTSCGDGDACTIGDACNATGQCVGGPARDCDDDNVCTDDSCVPASGCVNTANTAECSDGDACTNGDVCQNKACVAGPPLVCNDDRPCTDDSCNPQSGCAFVGDNTNTCNDGNFCTTQDSCDNGDCVGDDRLCNDNNPCTADSCDPTTRACVFAPIDEGGACSDGNACTESDICTSGVCAGVERTCGEGVCTGTCDPDMGCDYSMSEGSTCDDGDLCTLGEACSQGACSGGEAPDCDDGNECTQDSCDPVMGCQSDGGPMDGTACDADNDACTQNDACQAGACTAGEQVTCEGDMGCEGSCNSMSGQCDYPTSPCDDGDSCTEDETCDAGLCGAGAEVDCDDGDPCTDDSCDPMTGCVNEPNTGNACDDGFNCTTNDQCNAGTCEGTAVVCAAMDEDCQADSSCDESTGACVWSTATCDDGDECTTGEVCGEGGTCSGGGEVTCDDDNTCTDDYCDSATGCVFDEAAMDGSECDADADACTPVDTCFAGECVPDAQTSCDGEGGCSGTCDSQTGLCGYAPDICDDGNACTDGETCGAGGMCGGGQTIGCPPASNDCELAYCDVVLGCQLDLLSGTDCSDGDGCTEGDVCTDGVCGGNEVVCDDDDVCTADACVNGSCVFTPTATGDVDDTCDGIDDDCDGQTDEDYQVEITCGLGECEGTTGLEICRDGVPLQQCDAMLGATSELCDGLDNDCDGFADNGFLDTDCGTETVIYLIVNDPNGEPYGTARCYQPTGNGPIRCDTDPNDPTGRKLRVYDALLCPVE